MPDRHGVQEHARNRIGALSVLISGIFGLGFVPPASANPKAFKVPADSLAANLHTIVVLTTYVVDSPDGRLTTRTFDSLLVDALAGLGFDVVPPWVLKPHQDAARESAYKRLNIPDDRNDLVAVRRDSTMRAEMNRDFARRLREAYRADAAIHGAVFLMEATVTDNIAVWAGTRQELDKEDAKKKLSGRMPAYTYAAYLEDLEGQTLYNSAGGIETRGRIEKGKVHAVPDGEALIDGQRNSRAVEIALAPLAEKLGARQAATTKYASMPADWGAPITAPSLKLGETNADARLQADAMQLVLENDYLVDQKCKWIRFLDAKVTQPLKGAKLKDGVLVKGEWTELWSIDRCGMPVQYSLRFRADGKGGTDISPSRIP